MYTKEDILLGVLATIKIISSPEKRAEQVKKIFRPFCTELFSVYNEQRGNSLIQLSEDQKILHRSKIIKNFEYLVIIAKNLTPTPSDSKEHELKIILQEMWMLIEHFLRFHFVASFKPRKTCPSSRSSAGSSNTRCGVSACCSVSSCQATSR